MWSPASPVYNENRIPEDQTVHRKSGRTPLRVLGFLDPNCLNGQRLSLPNVSISTVLLSKETSNVCAGPTFKVEASPGDIYTEDSTTQSSSLDIKNSQSSSTESVSKIKCDNENGQSPDTDAVSPCQNQKAFNENKDVNAFNADHNTITSLPSDWVDNEHLSSEKEHVPICIKADCQESVSSDMLSQTCLNVCSEMRSVGLPEIVPDLDAVSSKQESIESLNGDPHPLPGKETGLEYNPSTTEGEACFQDQDGAEANVEITNSTFVISSPFAIETESCLLPTDTLSSLFGEISHLTSKIEYYGVFDKGDEDSFNIGSTINYSLDCDIQAERLTLSLPDDTVSEDITEQITNVSSIFWDSAVVLDKHDGISLADECSLPLDAHQQVDKLTVDEESSCNIENGTNNALDLQASTNKCFTPIPSEELCVKDFESERVMPTIQACHSSLVSDPQKCKEADSLAKYCCPTPVIPQSRSAEDLSCGRCVGKKITPRVLASFLDSGTSTTPVSISDDFTWMTPIMLLNKSMNTSWNLKGKGQRSARDNASETDPLLWNLSKEAFSNASREELVDRLEGTLIVVEALSKQLQGWQHQMVYSKPSEQRDFSTQTSVTYSNEAEQYYHHLYLKTLSRQQSLQCSLEDEKQLLQLLKESTKTLSSYKTEAAVMVEFAENLYEMVQQDRVMLNQKVKCTQDLLSDYMTSLTKIRGKIKDHLLEKEEMKVQMEKAILEKEAADQCLKDLQIHSSDVIAQLRQDMETERQLCDLVKDLYQQQHSYSEELVEFVHRACSVSSEMEDDRTQLQTQCSEAKGLMSRHWHLFNVMKEKTQSAVGEYESIKNELDIAVLENQQMCGHLEDLTSLNKQMALENSRLGSELESLMKTVCNLEINIEQWRLENAELSDKLNAKDLSSRLLEKELNEATARCQEYQDRMKYLSAEVVPRLELELSKVSSEKEALKAQLKALKREHASQIASYKESLEFLEQENEVCREQVKETESQLKTHHLNLLDRNFQCENLKDDIKELEKEMAELKQRLADTETKAQSTKAEMGKEISDASTEVSKIKGHLLDVIQSLKESSKGEVKVAPYGPQTPGGSLTLSSSFMEESKVLNTTDSRDQRVESIWSDKSAFTIVQPLTSLFSDAPVIQLADLLHDLNSIVSEVITSSSFTMEAKQHLIRNLNMDISSLKEDLHSQRFQHKSDVRDVQEEAEKHKRRICVLEEKLSSKEKHIKGLQELVQQHEKKILQQLAKVTENEELMQDNAKLKISIKLHENEVEVLKAALTINPTDSARNWVQEKVMLQKDLIVLSMKLSDTEYSKAEAIQKLMKHKDILTANLARSEAEVRKLDDIIDKIREVLHSAPDVVQQCDTLKHLIEFLN